MRNLRDHLSQRAVGVKQSAVRDVFDIAMDPNLVSLAGGNPWLADLPLDELGRIASDLMTRFGTESLQYGPGQGTEEMRAAATAVMAADGIPDADPDLVVITPGSQAAIDTACRAFANPGDVVVVEDPTFVGALTTFTTWQLEAVATGTDDHGLVPAALDETLTRLAAEGRRVAFLYTIPSFANPSGALLPPGRRAEVGAICEKHGVLIVEDNPYGQIAFDGEPVAPIAADHRDNVVHLGTMSKIFSPGVRIGWALVPAALKREFYLCAESAYIHASTYSQMLSTAFVTQLDWQGHVRLVLGVRRHGLHGHQQVAAAEGPAARPRDRLRFRDGEVDRQRLIPLRRGQGHAVVGRRILGQSGVDRAAGQQARGGHGTRDPQGAGRGGRAHRVLLAVGGRRRRTDRRPLHATAVRLARRERM